MFFQTFLFVLITSALVIPCMSQWIIIDPDRLDCKHQKTHHDCTSICACGWCEKKGCFDWPDKGRRSHAYRPVFSVCNVTSRSDVKTDYYTTGCKHQRNFFIFLGIFLAMIAYATGFALFCVIVVAVFGLCKKSLGNGCHSYTEIP